MIRAFAALSLSALVTACVEQGKPCVVSNDCAPGELCLAGACTADQSGNLDAGIDDAGSPDAGSDDAGFPDAGSPFVAPWGINEPNNAGGVESCLELRLTPAGVNGPGLWNDTDCLLLRPYACEATAATIVPAGCTIDDVSARLLCANDLSWSDAQASCESAQTTLAIVLDDAAADDLFVASAVALNGKPAVWLGANDLAVADVWRWVDDTPLASPFSSWAVAPIGGGAFNCLRLILVDTGSGAAGRWHEESCERSLPFVCDAPSATPAPAQCTGVVEGAKTRLFCTAASTAASAAAACAQSGGALAQVDSSAENATLTTNAQAAFGAEVTDVWLGGSDVDDEGIWSWPSGDVFDRF